MLYKLMVVYQDLGDTDTILHSDEYVKEYCWISWKGVMKCVNVLRDNRIFVKMSVYEMFDLGALVMTVHSKSYICEDDHSCDVTEYLNDSKKSDTCDVS